MTHVNPSSKEDEEAALKRFLRGRRNRRYAQLGAYVLICVVGSVGFARIQHNDALRCESADQFRDVARSQVLALYDLGIAAAQPPIDPETGQPRPRTPAEQQQVDQYIRNLKNYRDTQLKKIEDTKNSSCPSGEEN